ncbi:MAG: flavodoxin family protein [Campylobacteraceae bacterium]|nr:flavodoxin family protein [Campylobacteraceae bacterium]
MIKIAIIYYSKTNVTATLAQAIIAGANNKHEVTIVEHRIKDKDIIACRFDNPELFKELSTCDAIIFGTPTYMGGVSAQFKTFADATSELWCEQEWAGKIAAGFTCGSAFNGDQTGTLQYMVTLSSQQGMLWVGLDSAQGYNDKGVNRLGCQLGVVAQSTDGIVHHVDIETATYLGHRVAKLAKALKENKS